MFFENGGLSIHQEGTVSRKPADSTPYPMVATDTAFASYSEQANIKNGHFESIWLIMDIEKSIYGHSIARAKAGLGRLGAGWNPRKPAGRSRRKHFTFNSTSKITDKSNGVANGQRCLKELE